PTGTGMEPIGLTAIQDTVVALIPALESIADICPGRAGLKTEKCVRKIVTKVIELGWEVVRLRLALLAHQRGLGVVLVHVVRDRAQIIEELAVHRPAAEAVPQGTADQPWTFLHYRVGEGERLFITMHDPAKAFIGHASLISGRRRGREPAFIDAAAVRPVRIVILRGQLDAAAWHEK